MKVFISRAISPSLKNNLDKLGIDCFAQSLIKRSYQSFPQDQGEPKWIFFSSPYAVEAFFKQNPNFGTSKFAAIGKATATSLSQFTKVDFSGEGSDVQKTIEAFKAKNPKGEILFPCSNISLRTVQKAFPEQARDLVCYRTEYNSKKIEHCEILIFSSPSNVRSFLLLNEISKSQMIISFGKSTANCLEEHGCDSNIILKTTDDLEIRNAIRRLMNKQGI